MSTGSPTEDDSWTPIPSTEINNPKYAILNNDEIVMTREDDFHKREQLVTTMENLSESFSKLNASEHPAIKAMLSEREKEIEEEIKESEDGEDGQQYFTNKVPDEAVREELMGQHRGSFADQLEESAWEYLSKNFVSEGKEGDDSASFSDIDDSEDDWLAHANKKDEL